MAEFLARQAVPDLLGSCLLYGKNRNIAANSPVNRLASVARYYIHSCRYGVLSWGHLGEQRWVSKGVGNRKAIRALLSFGRLT